MFQRKCFDRRGLLQRIRSPVSKETVSSSAPSLQQMFVRNNRHSHFPLNPQSSFPYNGSPVAFPAGCPPQPRLKGKTKPERFRWSRAIALLQTLLARSLEWNLPLCQPFADSSASAVQETFDLVGLLLQIRINSAHQLIMNRRRVPCLDGYLDRVNLLLWPRFKVGRHSFTPVGRENSSKCVHVSVNSR